MNAGDRRYTDREVALVLKRAAELEAHRETNAPGRGLTLAQLHEIAREVGLSASMVDSAVAELSKGNRIDVATLLGPSALTKVVRAVPGVLDRSGMQQLIHLVEERLAATGTVTEALGSVRWTSTADGHQFNHTTQVSLTPSGAETQIQVTQRLSPRLQRVLDLLPGVWGAMVGLAVVASAGLATLPAAAVMGGGALLGVGIGRRIWSRMARRSQTKVDMVATDLVREAGRLKGIGSAGKPEGD